MNDLKPVAIANSPTRIRVSIPQSESAVKRSQEVAIGFFDSLGLRYETDDSTRRGLSYYLNGRGFEMRCTELGAQQQVVGGGAYREEPVSASALNDCCWR
jgi:histidyl-tRNA synthetase